VLTPARTRPVRRRADGEDGFALVTVLLTIVLLAAFSLVALQQTINNTAAARKDQDWVAALGAAQAGLDDYLSRLNDTNGAYYLYTTTSPDPANPAMGFDAGGAPKWASVPVAGTATAQGRYHYDVDTSTYTGTASVASNGNIVVHSTGRVGARTRTIKAFVRRSGFVDFVYFTDLETRDPRDYPPAQRADAERYCNDYYPARSAQTVFACQDIRFDNDVLSGPVHSNDTMAICSNVVFKDVVTTMSGPIAANGGLPYRTDGCSSTSGTTFARAGDPKQVKKVNLPSTNLALKSETSEAASPRGCLFVGPTRIQVKGTQLMVTSHWTKTPTPGCPKDTWFTIPVNGVVYVDVVPAEGTADINSWATTDPSKPTCPATGNLLGFPIASETGAHYPCKAGDVFVEQLDGAASHGLDGRLTISANNNLYITNHLEYASGTGARSFLGLIAEQFLYIWHPVSGSTNLNLPGKTTPFLDARISGALLSVNHAVMLQNHDVGVGLGTLTITGAITQKFRGAVGHGTSGYSKNYVYDQRLQYDAPPKFLNPLVSSFSAVRTAETKPQYR
jgi:Tfp pilus assembly protein PilX